MNQESRSTALPNPVQHRASVLGVFASTAASGLFGVVFFLPSLLHPMGADDVVVWRVIATLPAVTALLLCLGWWKDVLLIAARIRNRPALVGVVILNGMLLSVQLWMFGWGPQTGHSLDVALGYLLLPLVMVGFGITFQRERPSTVRIIAICTAAVGVVAAIVQAGGLHWATAVVAIGYPMYFLVRRRSKLDSVGALWFELIVMLPIALPVALQPERLAILIDRPDLLGSVVLLGAVGSVALILYLAASKVLTFGLFGLLSYLEPVLLVIVSLTLLGESFGLADLLVYGPMVVALCLLAVESSRAFTPVPDTYTNQRDSSNLSELA